MFIASTTGSEAGPTFVRLVVALVVVVVADDDAGDGSGAAEWREGGSVAGVSHWPVSRERSVEAGAGREWRSW